MTRRLESRAAQVPRPTGGAHTPRWMILAVGIAVAQTARPARAQSTTGVTAEATDNYCDASGNNCSSIICIAEADNYRNGLLNATDTMFTPGARWTDKWVYDTDFIDPDIQSGDAGNDTNEFDQAGNGTAYVCLHGTCNDMPGDTCSSAADCQSGGVCIADAPPANTSGHCAYYQDRYMITTADAYGNHYGGWINYSNGLVKWGENSTVGGWAGAGTNGGLLFALLSNSCGIRPGFDQQQTSAIFAGVPVLGIIMPTTYGSDDVDAPTRGTALSNAYVTNPGGSIAHAWTSSLAGIPYDDGGPCGAGDYTYGGGFGIGGCGAQVSQSIGGNQTEADWDQDTANWHSVAYPGNASSGASWQESFYSCNYDCYTYPFTL